MAIDYTPVDAAILERIGPEGCMEIMCINVPRVREELSKLGFAAWNTTRLIQNRLQALRKGGHIEYVRGAGWKCLCHSAGGEG